MTHAAANEFVRRLHRHSRPTLGAIFCVGVANEVTHGVAIAGRPVARRLDDGATVEVLRVATDGTRNACSMLYRACQRAAKELGYSRVVTYTLPDEGGASLRGPSRAGRLNSAACRFAGTTQENAMTVLVSGQRVPIGDISGMTEVTAQFNTGPNKGRSGSIVSSAGSSNLQIQQWVTDKAGNEVANSRVGDGGGATSPQLKFNGKSDLCQMDVSTLYTLHVSQVAPPQDGGPFGISTEYNQPAAPH